MRIEVGLLRKSDTSCSGAPRYCGNFSDIAIWHVSKQNVAGAEVLRGLTLKQVLWYVFITQWCRSLRRHRKLLALFQLASVFIYSQSTLTWASSVQSSSNLSSLFQKAMHALMRLLQLEIWKSTSSIQKGPVPRDFHLNELLMEAIRDRITLYRSVMLWDLLVSHPVFTLVLN
jgi:hypothetical protein